MKKSKRITRIKLVSLVLFLCSMFCTPASGVISLGWWEEGDPGTTHQFWEFLPEDVSTGGGVYEWTADATETNNTIAKAWIGHADYDQVGMFTIKGSADSILVHIELDNMKEPLPYKEIWVDLGYTGTLTDISATGLGDFGPYDFEILDPPAGSGVEFGIRIYPNPIYEDIFFSIEWQGDISPSLDWMHVDTICIPEPAAIVLLGLGSFVFLKRR